MEVEGESKLKRISLELAEAAEVKKSKLDDSLDLSEDVTRDRKSPRDGAGDARDIHGEDSGHNGSEWNLKENMIVSEKKCTTDGHGSDKSKSDLVVEDISDEETTTEDPDIKRSELVCHSDQAKMGLVQDSGEQMGEATESIVNDEEMKVVSNGCIGDKNDGHIRQDNGIHGTLEKVKNDGGVQLSECVENERKACRDASATQSDISHSDSLKGGGELAVGIRVESQNDESCPAVVGTENMATRSYSDEVMGSEKVGLSDTCHDENVGSLRGKDDGGNKGVNDSDVTVDEVGNYHVNTGDKDAKTLCTADSDGNILKSDGYSRNSVSPAELSSDGRTRCEYDADGSSGEVSENFSGHKTDICIDGQKQVNCRVGGDGGDIAKKPSHYVECGDVSEQTRHNSETDCKDVKKSNDKRVIVQPMERVDDRKDDECVAGPSKATCPQTSTQSTEMSVAELFGFMDDTFELRRSFITLEEPRIAVIMDKFPLLFTEIQLSLEFQRITNINAFDVLNTYVDKYYRAVFDLAKSSPACSSILHRASLASKNATTALSSSDLELLTFVCVIPPLLKEKLTDLIVEVDADSERIDTKGVIQPMLISRGDLFSSPDLLLVIEEEVVQEFDDFRGAFVALFASYWVFNMEYAATLLNTYTFFQKAVIKMKVATVLSVALKQFINKVERARKHSTDR